jgi:C-terminal processing protease CtpA/Prc
MSPSEVTIVGEASSGVGIGLMQRSSQVVVSSVEPASMAALQCVRVGSVLDAVNGQAVGNMEVNAVIEMIQAAERPWRLLLRVSPPPMRQNAASPF